jgi:hypothetical protein
MTRRVDDDKPIGLALCIISTDILNADKMFVISVQDFSREDRGDPDFIAVEGF